MYRRVLPKVQPGYLAPLIPDSAPIKPESWQDVMSDIERVIMPGITHWHSPKFHAYFPTANSYPAIVAVIFQLNLFLLYYYFAFNFRHLSTFYF